MDTGQLTESVIVYQDAPTTNSDGERVEVASEVCRRRAAVDPLAGSERRLPAQQVADATHRVTVRRDRTTEAITPRMWCVVSSDSSRRLNITRQWTDPQWVYLECTERV